MKNLHPLFTLRPGRFQTTSNGAKEQATDSWILFFMIDCASFMSPDLSASLAVTAEATGTFIWSSCGSSMSEVTMGMSISLSNGTSAFLAFMGTSILLTGDTPADVIMGTCGFLTQDSGFLVQSIFKIVSFSLSSFCLLVVRIEIAVVLFWPAPYHWSKQ
ncbi:hypothetical protein OUZ56_012479 [Daphnia magna]|uniref:Uncharacterized protein n=1 Tax=Daphnia magna TaxID=35525 RepID=A0ABQ9Z355_9CRUS|nr:hypothetical protein OUZ56_012479 [Daphnia magna]